jgi:hypothetical protein
MNNSLPSDMEKLDAASMALNAVSMARPAKRKFLRRWLFDLVRSGSLFQGIASKTYQQLVCDMLAPKVHAIIDEVSLNALTINGRMHHFSFRASRNSSTEENTASLNINCGVPLDGNLLFDDARVDALTSLVQPNGFESDNWIGSTTRSRILLGFIITLLYGQLPESSPNEFDYRGHLGLYLAARIDQKTHEILGTVRSDNQQTKLESEFRADLVFLLAGLRRLKSQKEEIDLSRTILVRQEP